MISNKQKPISNKCTKRFKGREKDSGSVSHLANRQRTHAHSLCRKHADTPLNTACLAKRHLRMQTHSKNANTAIHTSMHFNKATNKKSKPL